MIPVDAAGFTAPKPGQTARPAGEAMFKHVIGTRSRSRPRRARTACPPMMSAPIGEYNIAGEFWHVAPLFDELGLRILATLSGDGRFAEVQTMHRAQANMVVCAKALLNVARKLQDNFGTPFLKAVFTAWPTPRQHCATLPA